MNFEELLHSEPTLEWSAVNDIDGNLRTAVAWEPNIPFSYQILVEGQTYTLRIKALLDHGESVEADYQQLSDALGAADAHWAQVRNGGLNR